MKKFTLFFAAITLYISINSIGASSVTAEAAQLTIASSDASGQILPVNVYCDQQNTGIQITTAGTGTAITCPTTTQNVNLCFTQASQAYQCSAALTSGQFSGTVTPASCGGGSGATLGLAPISITSFTAVASCPPGAPPAPTGTLSAPANVTTTNLSNSSQQINWTASADSANPSDTITYTVNVIPAPSIPVQPTTTTSTTVTGLQTNTPYAVTVSATDPHNLTPVVSTPPVSFTITQNSGIPVYQTAFYKYFYSQNSKNPYGVDAPPGHFGTLVSGVMYSNEDARNNIIGNNIYADMKQTNEAGFSVVRAYDQPVATWAVIINEAAKNNTSVVYQVPLCQNIPTNSGLPQAGMCFSCSGKSVVYGNAFADETKKQLDILGKVIDAVTPAKFNSTVKVVLVGNEDLANVDANGDECSGNPMVGDISNASDLVSAINQARSLLTSKSISSDMPVTTSIQADVMMGYNPQTGTGLQSRKVLADGIKANNPTYPVLAINVYPNQWGVPANCSVNGNCTSTMCNPASQCNAVGPMTPAEASAHALSTVMQTLSAYKMPMMIAETGWPTSGSNSNYVYTGTFNVADAATFYQSLYPYVTSQQIPLLAFQIYNQPGKNPANLQDAENHYGLMTSDNNFKAGGNEKLLPSSNTIPSSDVNNKKYDSSKLAYLVFTGLSQGNVYYPNMLHVKLIRPSYDATNPLIDQDFAVYTDHNNPIWPQLLAQVGDIFTISTLANEETSSPAQSCTGTVAATPYLDTKSPTQPTGTYHIGAQFNVTSSGTDDSGYNKYAGWTVVLSGSQCNAIFSTPSNPGAVANVFGIDKMATNVPTVLNVSLITVKGYTQGYVSIPGTVCDPTSSTPPSKNSACTFGGSGPKNFVVSNVAAGTTVTFNVTNGNGACTGTSAAPATISSTLGKGGQWNPGGTNIGCGSNFTNAVGAANASIWLP